MSMRLCFPGPEPRTISDRTTPPVTNLFSRPEHPFSSQRPAVTSVWFDQSDRIVCLPDSWDDFVETTGLTGLERDVILGRPLSWFIEDETARSAFRALFQNTRREKRPARITTRCDARRGPARAMQLDFVAHAADAISATWRFVDGSTAEMIPIVRPRFSSPDELIRACGWCWRVHLGTAWHRLDQAAPALGLLDRRSLPAVTHGICPRCAAALRAECTHEVAV